MIKAINTVKELYPEADLAMRIGINSGSVLCGVLGLRKWQFDVWSTDVTIANHLESGGIPGQIHVSQATLDALSDKYEYKEGEGGGRDTYLADNNITTYLIEGRVEVTSEDPVVAQDRQESTQSPLSTRSSNSTVLTTANLPRIMISSSENDSGGNSWTPEIPFESLTEAGAEMERKASLEEELDNLMDISIEIASNKRMKRDFIHPFKLTFRDKDIERKYSQQNDYMYKSSVFCIVGVWIFVTLSELAQIPIHLAWISRLQSENPSSTSLSLPVSFGLSFTLASTLLFLFILTFVFLLLIAESSKSMPSNLRQISHKFLHSRNMRKLVIGFTVFVMSLSCLVASFDVLLIPGCPPSPQPIAQLRSSSSVHLFNAYRSYSLQYLIHIWIVSILSLSAFIKLYYLYKAILLLFMFTTFAIIIIIYISVCDDDNVNNIYSIFYLLLFTLHVLYHGRQVEIASSLDFLWKQQARKELEEMSEMRRHTNQLLQNLLPLHVAKFFLAEERISEDLFAEARANAGVLFASIPNFTEFYSEDVNEGVECIRLLNEIIVDFDELLDDEKFRNVEKIKTIGSTYMAASGISPIGDAEDEFTHLCDLIDFAAEMNFKLDDINKHSFNEFQLRIGIAVGALVCGVIGATKPVFDIWGDTVNEASRMDSTGLLGCIQASHKTAMILSERGYAVKERGVIKVKGKGLMRTYFVLGRKISRGRYGKGGSGAANTSLAEVVYGMVRARRRRTFKREREDATEKATENGEALGSNLAVDVGPSKISRQNPIRRSLRRLGTLRSGSRSPMVEVTLESPTPPC